MERSFGSVLAELRRERKLSQRKLSADLNISQALLSHYENGSREPGLAFVKRACTYFGVSADFLLGISPEKGEHSAHTKQELPWLKELSQLLEEGGNMAAKDAAEAYLEAGAKRLCGYITKKDEVAFFAHTTWEMAEAELSLLHALSPDENNKNKA
ncbi:MAG: helix-turn-helix transcriptional regulator [Clostridiales bacterium]|nr:helix-turn-helix transcriptional regulator [Clostridiales bacterium]